MTMRQITPANGAPFVSATAPSDPYSTLVTFAAGQLLDVLPGGPWEAAIGLVNLTTLSGVPLADELGGEGSNPGGTANA